METCSGNTYSDVDLVQRISVFMPNKVDLLCIAMSASLREGAQ